MLAMVANIDLGITFAGARLWHPGHPYRQCAREGIRLRTPFLPRATQIVRRGLSVFVWDARYEDGMLLVGNRLGCAVGQPERQE